MDCTEKIKSRKTGWITARGNCAVIQFQFVSKWLGRGKGVEYPDENHNLYLRNTVVCVTIFTVSTNVFRWRTVKGMVRTMGEKYYVVREKAVPEVLLKVVEAKRLLDSEKAMTVQEATEMTGISRSSFYKYKDDIFPFHDNVRGRTVTLMLQLDDQPGLLSNVLNHIARCRANILTIHQAIPVNGIASLTLSIDVLSTTGDISALVEEIEGLEGIHYIKILARE